MLQKQNVTKNLIPETVVYESPKLPPQSHEQAQIKKLKTMLFFNNAAIKDQQISILIYSSSTSLMLLVSGLFFFLIIFLIFNNFFKVSDAQTTEKLSILTDVNRNHVISLAPEQKT